MAKTRSSASAQKARASARPKAGSKRRAPSPWYQRIAWTLGVGLVVLAVVFIASRPGGSDAPVESSNSSQPVVGADLHSLVVDPSNPDTLYIGSHQGVSVSEDGGDSWELVKSLEGADAMGWTFDEDAIYVGGHPGLLVSSDGGATFEARSDTLPNADLHALGGGDGTIYAASPGAGFIASTDGGETWEVRNEEVGSAFMGRILVDPTDGEHVLAPDMQAGAVESRDGGRSWKSLGGLQGATWVSWNPSNTEEIIVSSIGSAARSTDAGKTWDAVAIPPGAALIEFSPHAPETLYGAVHEDPNARVYISEDGAKTWREV